MSGRVITLTTDFGLKDPYVAEMKATILTISPDARIVDITHLVEKYNIDMGAYILTVSSPYFPRSTIHVAVVDPGVGSKRRAILIETKKSYFVGPDNGLLALAAENEGIVKMYRITNEALMLFEISSTFHGRDIFASAAGHLSSGIDPVEFGPEIRSIMKRRYVKIKRDRHTLTGRIIHIDDFGNIVTNLKMEDIESSGLSRMIVVEFEDARLEARMCRVYSEAKEHEALALVGSHNLLEISVNRGNAARAFRVNVGEKISVYRRSH